jgi:hypothetical protein
MLDLAQQGNHIVKRLRRDWGKANVGAEVRNGKKQMARATGRGGQGRCEPFSLTGNLLPPRYLDVVDLFSVGQERPSVLAGGLPVAVDLEAQVVYPVAKHARGSP